MRFRLVLLAGVLSFATSASAQTVAAALNSARYGISGLPGYGVAQGSMATAFGTGFPDEVKKVTSLPLTTTWEGVSVAITVNGTTVAGYPLYMQGKTQFAFIVPSNAPVGTGTFTVTVNGTTSAPAPITILPSNLGAFTVAFSGQGPGVLLDPSGTHANGLTYAANPGELWDIWGTGLGAVNASTEAAGPLPGDIATATVKVTVGGKPAAVAYKGRSGCCIGLDQIRITIPSGITGCYVPTVVNVNGQPSNYFTISVAASGRTCSDPTGLSEAQVNAIANGGKYRVGSINLTRASTSISFGGISLSMDSDTGSGAFEEYDYSKLSTSSVPPGVQPFGSCIVYSFKGGASLPTDAAKPKALDAGPQLNLTGPNGPKALAKDATGFYSATLSSAGVPPVGYLDPGAYSVAGPGGADVGVFNASLTIPTPLVWTNESSITTVVRANGQLVTWTGGDPNGYIYILGFSGITQPQEATVGFLCTAKVSDQSFTIPSDVLLALPPSPANLEDGIGFLSVGASVATPFTAPLTAGGNLDQGFFTSTVSAAETVTYQ
jgi:uncharacterized protein (TIGR03437 family)